MARNKATQAAPAPAETAVVQTEQTEVQSGGQLIPATEVEKSTDDQSAGDNVQSEQLEQSGDTEVEKSTDDQSAGDPVANSLIIINNSPSLQAIPTVNAVIEPHGSFVVTADVLQDTDRIQRLKTEVSALNELKGYEMIELRSADAAAK